MKRTIQLVFIGIISLITPSCSSQSNSEIIEIRYGSLFGMCEGYCYSEMIYTESIKKSISKAWGDTTLYPTKIDTKEIQKARWSKLTNSFDLKDFYSLEPTIGCPDCADGGESWIEIKESNKSYRVSYEYGNIPKSIEELVEELKN